MQEWLIEHVVLGDTSDEIPRITDGCKFSKEFLEHLESKGLGDLDICEFEDDNVKREFALNGFTVQKVNAKGQELGLKIFDNPKVGVKTIKKEVQKYGSLENWVNTSKILRKHFERNKELILMDYIPKDIKNAIIRSYNESSSEYHEKEFAEYCRSNNLARLLSELPPNFKSSLSVDSLLEGW
jgi:5'-3' exonuclease